MWPARWGGLTLIRAVPARCKITRTGGWGFNALKAPKEEFVKFRYAPWNVTLITPELFGRKLSFCPF